MTYDEYAQALARKSRIARYIRKTAYRPAANDTDPGERLKRLEPLIDAMKRKSDEIRELAELIEIERRRP